MTALFNTPKGNNWVCIILIYLALFLIAFSISGCKSRKVEKSFDKTVDRSEQKTDIKRTTERKDSVKVKTKSDVKEAIESNNTFDTETNTVINFDTAGRIKSAVINKRSKGSAKFRNDKADNSITGFDYGHSEIINLDSTGSNHNDIKAIGKTKTVDAKMNWVQIGVGLGLFVLILFAGFMIYKKLRR